MRRIRRGVGENLLRGSIYGASGQGGFNVVEHKNRNGSLRGVKFLDSFGRPIRLNKAIMSTMPTNRMEIARRVKEINSVRRGTKSASERISAIQSITPHVEHIKSYFVKLGKITSIRDGHNLAMSSSGKSAARAFNPITDATCLIPELKPLTGLCEFEVAPALEQAIAKRARISKSTIVKSTADYIDYKVGGHVTRLVLSPKGLHETAREREAVCEQVLATLHKSTTVEQAKLNLAQKLEQAHATEKKFLLGKAPAKGERVGKGRRVIQMNPNQVADVYKFYSEKRAVNLAKRRAVSKEVQQRMDRAKIPRVNDSAKYFDALYARIEGATTFKQIHDLMAGTFAEQEARGEILYAEAGKSQSAIGFAQFFFMPLLVPESMEEHRAMIEEPRRKGVNMNKDVIAVVRPDGPVLVPLSLKGLQRFAKARREALEKLRSELVGRLGR